MTASGSFVINTTGGVGVSANGEIGRYILERNASSVTASQIGTMLELYSALGQRKTNPFLSSGAATPFIAGLMGGANGYGLLNGITANSFSSVMDSSF